MVSRACCLVPTKRMLSPGGYGIDQELIGGVEKPDGALEIYDINPVASTKDERFHFGVPPARLVAEMDPGFEQLFHSDNCHSTSPSGFASAPLHPAAQLGLGHQKVKGSANFIKQNLLTCSRRSSNRKKIHKRRPRFKIKNWIMHRLREHCL